MKQQTSLRGHQPLTISAKEMAEILSVSTRQIWRLNSEKKIPKPIRIGRLVRWNRREILNWFNLGCLDRDTWSTVNKTSSVIKNLNNTHNKIINSRKGSV